MAQMLMTEALAEIKTLSKRLSKKRAELMPYLWRQEGLKDPMEKEEDGSVGFVKRERQSIRDLEARFVSIRSAIQQVNQGVSLTIEGETHTMAWWMNWRKEIATDQLQFINLMRQNIVDTRKTWQGRGANVVNALAGEAPKQPIDIIINVDEKVLMDEGDKIERILGALDGQLSLKLATTAIEVL